ncbi:MAG: hypothetical protein JSS34_08440 [Proteobacteria bacterium]|nr:hypothetical protein [Pseudomonadota bacterium]
MSQQFEQVKGADSLLGKERRVLNLSGKIESFWCTSIFARVRMWSSEYSETKGGIGALANRLARFELPEQKHETMEFHVYTLQFLAETLLKIKKPKEEKVGEGFVYKMFQRDEYKKENLRAFIEHFAMFAKLSTLKKEFGRLIEGRESEPIRLGKATEEFLDTYSYRFETRLSNLRERFNFVSEGGDVTFENEEENNSEEFFDLS